MATQDEQRAMPGCGPRAGVYSITCRPTGRTYVGCSDHLARQVAADRTQLSGGRHPNAALQADWDAHGHDAFDVAIHDELSREESAAITSPALESLRDLWVDQLGLDEGRSY